MSKNIENKSAWKRFLDKMTKAQAIENEEEIVLDHNYDGIRELDNVLPPWWLAGFYITIVVMVIYAIRVFFFGAYNQYTEFNTEMADAKAAVEQYKKDHPELFDDSNIVLLTSEADLAEGKKLFAEKTCTACHKADLGGLVGPNLTDDKWILGGGIKGIFNTISKGGREGKGMPAWESTISRDERQKLASYIISMVGTNPADAKAPEGDITWTPEK